MNSERRLAVAATLEPFAVAGGHGVAHQAEETPGHVSRQGPAPAPRPFVYVHVRLDTGSRPVRGRLRNTRMDRDQTGTDHVKPQ